MGSCASIHVRSQKSGNSMGGCFSIFKKKKKRRTGNTCLEGFKDGLGRGVHMNNGIIAKVNRDENEGDFQVIQHDEPQASPCGNKGEVWFESRVSFDSDSEDEYKSVFGEFIPSPGSSLSHPLGAQGTPRPTFSALKKHMSKNEAWDGISVETLIKATCPTENQSLGDIPLINLPHGKEGTLTEDEPSSSARLHVLVPSKVTDCIEKGKDMVASGTHIEIDIPHRTPGFHAASLEDAKINDGYCNEDWHRQHVQKKSCLPCLLTNVKLNGKKRSLRLGIDKKGFLLPCFSFKNHPIDHENLDFFPLKGVIDRPIAGLQVPFCPADKLIEGCWSTISPSTFKIRSHNYLKDKKKIFASEHPVYVPIRVDVYLSAKKLNHIAQYVELPPDNPVGNLPPLLIINVQIPMYSAAIFFGESDGEGMNLVLYFRLSEDYARTTPPHIHELLRKFFDDEMERVKGLTREYTVPFRRRLKILSRVINPKEIHLNALERRILLTYNERPVLSWPQHNFYKGTNYFEIDLDMHRFNWIARKAVEVFRERLKLCVLDFGLTIQGNRHEELPEQILCFVQVIKLDFCTFKQLVTTVSSHPKCEETYATKACDNIKEEEFL